MNNMLKANPLPIILKPKNPLKPQPKMANVPIISDILSGDATSWLKI